MLEVRVIFVSVPAVMGLRVRNIVLVSVYKIEWWVKCWGLTLSVKLKYIFSSFYNVKKGLESLSPF